MNLSNQSIQAIANIKKHFNEAEREFRTLSSEENHDVLDFHNEGSSLNHCIRWGLQAAEEILEHVKYEELETPPPVLEEDFEQYLSVNIEGIVEGHLDAWKSRYHRKKLEDVVYDLRVNHDQDAEIESFEDGLGRTLTDEERTYFYEAFIAEVENVFYL